MNLHDPDYFPQLHGRGVRPLPARCGASAVQSLRVAHILDATRCHGIFGSGDKNQSTTNTQIGASEEANLEYTTGSNTSKGGLLGVTGSNLSNVALGGVSLGGANSGSITINGAAGVEDATRQFSEVLEQVTDQSGEIVSDALNKVSSLAESKQTDGISSLGKIALWGLGIVALGGVGYAVLTRKRT